MVVDRVQLRPLGGRSLKTAAEALAALRILGDAPAGVTPDVLAAALGKSAATARYLLNTLAQEGFATRDGAAGVHRLVPAPPWGQPWGRPGPAGPVEPPGPPGLPEGLADAVSELHRRTGERTYLARWEDDASIVVDARGGRGLARVADLAERLPLSVAHAPALTKALLAGSDEMRARAVGQSELTGFTPATITEAGALSVELEQVRRRGVALDREEFAEGFCCVGAPVHAPDGRVTASLAVATSAQRFAGACEEIARVVSEVAVAATRRWREHEAPPGSPTRTIPRPSPRPLEEVTHRSTPRSVHSGS